MIDTFDSQLEDGELRYRRSKDQGIRINCETLMIPILFCKSRYLCIFVCFRVVIRINIVNIIIKELKAIHLGWFKLN